MSNLYLCRMGGLKPAALSALLILAATFAWAEVPTMIGYQGSLSRINGAPLDTTVNVTFALFADSIGGHAMWLETHENVQVSSGAFQTKLGKFNPLTADDFINGNLWLGVRVGNNSEMTPRLRIGATPYAYRTATIDAASGGIVVGDVQILGKMVIGTNNEAMGEASFVAGFHNVSYQDFSVISGGDSNFTYGDHSVVSGGHGNIAVGDYSNIGGGSSNVAGLLVMRSGERDPGEGDYSTVGGGMNNIAAGDYSTVGGGKSNQAIGENSSILGGHHNIATGDSATICGGSFNAAGSFGTVCGGASNSANGDFSFVGGGMINQADSLFSVIPGGYHCYAGNYSFASGYRAKAIFDGCFRWADSHNADFSAPDTANSFSARAAGGVYFFTSSNLSSGVALAPGGSDWYSYSDSTMKRNIRLVDTRDVLDRVAQLPMKRWSYAAQDESIEHIGPMAQDFWNLFHVGGDSLRISTIDPAGIALAAIQELAKQNQDLQKELATLRAQFQSHLAQEKQTSNREE